jgi:hypothetical protein
MIASLSRPLVSRVLTIALAGAMCLTAPMLVPPLLAGPNEGGTLVVHDTGLSYTEEVSSYPSPPPTTDPPTVDNALPVGPPASAAGWVWKVYAAFPTNSSPRLKAITPL